MVELRALPLAPVGIKSYERFVGTKPSLPTVGPESLANPSFGSHPLKQLQK